MLEWTNKHQALYDPIVCPPCEVIEDKQASKEWDTTGNVLIEGDNLHSLAYLQENFAKKINLIYADPPYNTGKSRIYDDKFGVHGKKWDEKHAPWLNFMAPRLRLAEQLLSDNGVLLISIDSNELAELKLLCDELFTRLTFLAIFPWKKRTAFFSGSHGLSRDVEWIIAYGASNFKAGRTIEHTYYTTDDQTEPWRTEDVKGKRRNNGYGAHMYPITNPRTNEVYEPRGSGWIWSQETLHEKILANRIIFPGDYKFLNISRPMRRIYQSEDARKNNAPTSSPHGSSKISTWLEPHLVGYTASGSEDARKLFGGKEVFAHPKPVALLKYFLQCCAPKEGIVLDIFGGSGTTAQAVMEINAEHNRHLRWITLQIDVPPGSPSVAADEGFTSIFEITRQRIIRAGESLRRTHPLLMSKVDRGLRVIRLRSEVESATPDVVDQLARAS